jgi:hypothetical protein
VFTPFQLFVLVAVEAKCQAMMQEVVVVAL